MKLSVLRENFADALSVVIRVVDSRPSVPVLGNVLLEAESGGLRLTTQNLSVRIHTVIGANVDREGSITLPAKHLLEVVNSFGGERVSLDLNAKNLRVMLRSGLAEFEVAGIKADEFPPPNEMEVESELSIPYTALDELYRRTAYAASNDINQETITALHFLVKPDSITATALDGVRVGQATVAIENGHDAVYLIPARLLELVRTVMEDTVRLSVGVVNKRRGEHVMLDDGRIMIFGSLTAGRFPDISPLIPESYATEVRVDSATLLGSLKRANILAREQAFKANIFFEKESSQLFISLESAERGKFNEKMLVEMAGDDLQLRIDIRYLIDAINAYAEHSELMFSGNGSKRHLIISGDDNSLAIVTPASS